MVTPAVMPLLSLLLACQPDPAAEVAPPTPEPIVLPDDPAERGAPVGVRTETWNDLTLEVWYPAPDSVAGEATEPVDFYAHIPGEVEARVGAFSFPAVDSGAVRDAPLRWPEAPYPVLVFSHGFGGVREQSVSLTTHLASRGYVVVATDHVGRRMEDLLPCVFSPPLDGCNLEMSDDPGVDDVQDLADWVEASAADGWLAGAIDPETLGLFGHSAGAGTTVTAGGEDDRWDALLPMAGAGGAGRDVPELMMGGTCDSFASDADMVEIAAGAPELVRVLGAGHLAFSDLCALDIGDLGNELFVGRDDVNNTMVSTLIQLGIDGCDGWPPPESTGCGEYLPLETSDPIVRHYATAFFDVALQGTGPGVQDGVYGEVEVVP